MKRALSLVVVISIILLHWSPTGAVSLDGPAKIPKATQHNVLEAYGRLPVNFEANRGQTDPLVRFLSRGRGYTLFLAPTEAILSFTTREAETKAGAADFAGRVGSYKIRAAVLRMQLVGTNPNPKIIGLEELPGKTHYFVGKNARQWRTNVATYARVLYKEIYPGIDLIYHGNQRKLEYDFVVEPGTDPTVITLAFESIDKLQIDAQGDLVVHGAGGEVRWQKPVIYQMVDGARKPVAGTYDLRGSNQVGFQVAAHDSKKPLIIDPVLSYSTYLGGGGDDIGFGIAVDSAGNAYVTGDTASLSFPTTAGVFDTDCGTDTLCDGTTDAFVTKLDPTGSILIYSTYVGGNKFDRGYSIAVNSSGNAYVVGVTDSPNFPTVSPIQAALGGLRDAFVMKLDPAGSNLIYSTYLGGSGSVDEFGIDIAVDASGNAYVVGVTDSPNFPTTAGAFQPLDGGGTPDAFVVKLNQTGSALVYSTYLGGSRQDFGRGIAVDASGNAYVTGYTTSDEFPATVGAFDTRFGGAVSEQAFVTKLNQTGSALVYSTSLGGIAREFGRDIAVDSSGNAYVMGKTNSSSDFPTSMGAFQTVYGGGDFDVFVTKLNAAGSALLYSTFLGGSGFENFGGDDSGSLAVDGSGNAYVTGETTSVDFPTANPLQPSSGDGQDAFVTKLNAAGSALVYSTYLGGTHLGLSARDVGVGIAVDTVGNAYVTGLTGADNFLTVNPLQPLPASVRDAFIAKISGVLEVDIDIKPGSDPNSINLGSNGNVPVAIFSTADFDATTVDPLTVTLADAGVKVRGNGTPMADEQDVNGDGLLDLVVHVDTEGLQLTETDVQAVLRGETFGGTPVEGADSVRVVP